MAATATSSRSASPNPNVVLRAARLEAQKRQLGRTAPGSRRNLSTLPAQPSRPPQEEQWLQRSPVARMRADRHAVQRFANPGASTPRLQEMSSSLRDGDTDQEDDANDIEEQEAQIADENDQAQSLQLAARARSRAKAATGDASQKMMEQAMKKGQELLEEVKAEITSKAGAADDGELLLVANTVLTGMSVTRSVMGIFSETLQKYNVILSKVGLPIPKHLKMIGGAGTAFEVALYVSIICILLFILVFFFLTYGTIANAIHGDVKNALTILRGL